MLDSSGLPIDVYTRFEYFIDSRFSRNINIIFEEPAAYILSNSFYYLLNDFDDATYWYYIFIVMLITYLFCFFNNKLDLRVLGSVLILITPTYYLFLTNIQFQFIGCLTLNLILFQKKVELNIYYIIIILLGISMHSIGFFAMIIYLYRLYKENKIFSKSIKKYLAFIISISAIYYIINIDIAINIYNKYMNYEGFNTENKYRYLYSLLIITALIANPIKVSNINDFIKKYKYLFFVLYGVVIIYYWGSKFGSRLLFVYDFIALTYLAIAISKYKIKFNNESSKIKSAT